jgi:hypothetical protein
MGLSSCHLSLMGKHLLGKEERVGPIPTGGSCTSYKLCYTRSMKLCKTCGVVKPLDEFHRNKTRPDGRVYSCKPCTLTRVKQWQKDNPEKYKANWQSKSYTRHGITEADYLALLEKQGGVCAACGNPPSGAKFSGQRLNIDHDHACCPGDYSCGSCIRGLLCVGCNSALGHLQDSVERLEQLKRYLTN